MSAALPCLPALTPCYRSWGEWDLSMAAAHSRPDYPCPLLPSCGYRGQHLVERRREGRQEEHQQWQQRQLLIPGLRRMVKQLLGGGEVKENLIFHLFKREGIMSKVKLIETSDDSGEREVILTRLRTEVLEEKKRRELRPLLWRVARKVLGDKEGTLALLDRLLEEEKVVETLLELETVEEDKEGQRYRQLWKQMEDMIGKEKERHAKDEIKEKEKEKEGS